MLSLAGDIPDLLGVGEGAGLCSGVNTLAEVFARSGNRRATAPLAMAKEFSDKPATHARAHDRMATFLGDFLGIIPSSGDWLNFRHALARNAWGTNIQSARRTTRQFSLVVKDEPIRGFIPGSFTVSGLMHANSYRVASGPGIVLYCFAGADFSVSGAGALAGATLALVMASTGLGTRNGLISTAFSRCPSLQTTS